MDDDRLPLPRANRAKHRLAAGGSVTVVASQAMSSDLVDVLGPLGFDGVWIEGEHGNATWDRLGDLSRAADLWGMSALYRVRTLDESLVARALALGVHGIVVPQVSTPEDAARLVRAAKFAPVGERGVSRGRRALGVADFLERENDETMLVVQLEDPAALDNVEDICAVDGIDVVFVAPNDLAQAMGRLGRPSDPEVVAALDDAVRRIVATGRVAGTFVGLDDVDRFRSLGVRFMYTPADALLAAAAGDWLRSVISGT